MFSWIWIRLILFFRGIRFYETDVLPSVESFGSAEFSLIDDCKVTFSFYKETCTDLIYRRGQISEDNFVGYTVHAQLDNASAAGREFRYNNLKFFFHCPKGLHVDDGMISRYLLSIFLDRIKATYQ